MRSMTTRRSEPPGRDCCHRRTVSLRGIVGRDREVAPTGDDNSPVKGRHAFCAHAVAEGCFRVGTIKPFPPYRAGCREA